MKDRQIELDGGEPRIPIVSAALHCVAITVLVFLRSSFGFVYLRPKSVFFAFSWAFVLFTIFAWNEPDVWSAYRTVCIFGAAAIALYWLHLFVAVSSQWREKGPHDRYSGTSNALWLMRWAGMSPTPSQERSLHLWAEPAAVVVAALAFRFLLGERHLSAWFFFVAGCFWCKEALNRWFELRQTKRQKDIFDDATDTPDAPSATILGHEAPKATRKEPVKRKRNSASAAEADREKRFAELLRVREPYSLEKAEEHYKALVQLEHPDANENSPESNAATAELNEAIAFFRERLGA